MIFLGTGTGSSVVGKGLRNAGGIILQSGENQIHIDPGVGAVVGAAFCQVNLRATNTILVSHNHLYHSNDLNAVIDAMSYGGLDKKGVLVAAHSVINPIEGDLPFLKERYKHQLERFIVLRQGQRVGINELEIVALKAKHGDPNAIGFKIFTPKFTISYTGDTKFSKELFEEYKHSNILILNLKLKDGSNEQNLCMEDAIEIINEVRPKLAIVTHFGVDLIKSDPLYEVREIQKATGIPVIAAKDGMIINPLNYSVDLGQKTLQGFENKTGIRAPIDIDIKEALKSDKPLEDLFKTGLKDKETNNQQSTLQ